MITAAAVVTAVVDEQQNDDDEQDPGAIVTAEQVAQTHICRLLPFSLPLYARSAEVSQLFKNKRKQEKTEENRMYFQKSEDGYS